MITLVLPAPGEAMMFSASTPAESSRRRTVAARASLTLMMFLTTGISGMAQSSISMLLR